MKLIAIFINGTVAECAFVTKFSDFEIKSLNKLCSFTLLNGLWPKIRRILFNRVKLQSLFSDFDRKMKIAAKMAFGGSPINIADKMEERRISHFKHGVRSVGRSNGYIRHFSLDYSG